MTGTRLLTALALIVATVLVAAASGIAAAALVCGALGLCAGLALHREPPAQAPAATVEPEPTLSSATLIEALDDPVLLIERRTITAANTAARALLGEHIVGEDARVAMRHPDAAARLAGPPARERGVALEGLGRRESRWELAIAPVGDDCRLVHLVDRSAAHAAETMRVDFVANASHELRTPLAALLGFIETLADPHGPDDAATRQRFLGIMQREAQRMRQLVDDLISLSRIEAERHRAPDAAVPLAQLATLVAEAMRVAADEPPGTFVIESDPALPPVAGDEAQLSQLLHNLLGNAVKYRRPGTVIRTAVTAVTDGIQLAVTDEGDGIAPEHLPRLTERFYRVDAGRSRSVGGTGLGLAIVKHIVERHRGRLDIASIVGVGTTVTVTLPAAQPATESQKSHETVTEVSPLLPSAAA